VPGFDLFGRIQALGRQKLDELRQVNGVIRHSVLGETAPMAQILEVGIDKG